jgi:hypothetical protein
MTSMKVLRSACMLAIACGVVATVDAIAQTRDTPASSQVRKATVPKAAKQTARKQTPQARHGKKKSKPVAASKSRPGKPVAKARHRKQPVATAKKAPATTVANRPARPLPPPLVWIPPPLGPERFYPHGIPELRPEFLHPEAPPARVDQAANTRPERLGGQPEWLP